jgi:hypothetical protein
MYAWCGGATEKESLSLAVVQACRPNGFIPEYLSRNRKSVRPSTRTMSLSRDEGEPMTIVHFSEPNSFFRLYCGLTKNRIGCLASLAM